MKRPELDDRRWGWALVVMGLLANRFILGWTLTADGTIDPMPWRVLIDLGDVALVAVGLIWILRGPHFLAGLSGLGRRVVPLTVALTVSALFFAFAEGISYLGLHQLAPREARQTLRRHALVGNPSPLPAGGQPAAQMISFHPLHGWRLSSFRKDVDAHGFNVNRPGDTNALEAEADPRIFVLGGSTVAGAGLRPEVTIPALLERGLERAWDRQVNVVNLGVGGYSSVNQLSLLIHLVIPFFEPDALIVLDGFNDVKRAMTAARRLARKPERPVVTRSRGEYLYDPKLNRYRRQFQAIRNNATVAFNQFLYVLGLRRYLHPDHYFTTSLLKSFDRDATTPDPTVHRFRTLLRSPKEGLPLPPDQFQTLLAKRRCRETEVDVYPYRQNVRSTVALAAERKIPILYALQPTLFFKERRADHERVDYQKRLLRSYATGRVFHRFDLAPRSCLDRVFRTFFRRARPLFEPSTDSPDRRSRIRLVDLSRLFADHRRPLFLPTDIVHYNPRGNELIARRLKDHLVEMAPSILGESAPRPPARPTEEPVSLTP